MTDVNTNLPVDLDALERRLAQEPTWPLDKDWLAVRFFLDRADMTKLVEEARRLRAGREAWKTVKEMVRRTHGSVGDPSGLRALHVYGCPMRHQASNSERVAACLCGAGDLDAALA